MSDSGLPKKSTDNKVETEFTTENIGRWASKQENPFAAQNRRTAAKKQKQNEARKKATPYVAAIAGVIASVVAIIGLIFIIIALVNRELEPDGTPTIAGGTAEDIVDYREILQNFYNNSSSTQEEKVQEVNDFVQDTLSTSNGREYEREVKIAQAAMYMNNGLYFDAINTLDGVSADGLGLDQQQMYYNILYYCYACLGNYDKADEYTNTLYEIISELEDPEK